MQFDEFINSTKEDAPPQSLSESLQAMWHAQKGDWETAHNIAQNIKTEFGSWIHAYLHRVEGDLSNAGYWYKRAGKPKFQGSTEAEADEIINSIL
ncbi:MAG: hypothetical protein H8E85_05815 [Candidatus Marinimicrobia bacterium]|nr:hypothetical protein [Candidatus Neomarinimicrobiota bacterium]